MYVIYRLPVLVVYLGLVAWTSFFPARKEPGLIDALPRPRLLVAASQFWYLDKGGTLVLLYLPLVLLMMFRPTLLKIFCQCSSRPLQPPPTRDRRFDLGCCR